MMQTQIDLREALTIPKSSNFFPIGGEEVNSKAKIFLIILIAKLEIKIHKTGE